MLRFAPQSRRFLLSAAAGAASAFDTVAQAISSNPNMQQDPASVSPHSSSTTKSPTSSSTPFYFASGYAIPDAVVSVMRAMEGTHRFHSSVWFTVHQCQMMRIKIKDGEQPIRVDCPPGSTRKPTLILFNADQTVQPTFFPSVLKGSATTYQKERELQQAMLQQQQQQQQQHVGRQIDDGSSNESLRRTTTTTTTTTTAKPQNNEKVHPSSSYQQDVRSDVRPLPIPEDGATTPHFQGGYFSSTTATNTSVPSSEPEVPLMFHNAPPAQRHMPRHMWTLLSSVAAQHRWTSNYWYTRSGMRNAGMTPRLLSTTTTALPLVVRMHHHNGRSSSATSSGGTSGSIPMFQHLWNADQLQPLASSSPDFVEQEEEQQQQQQQHPSHHQAITFDLDAHDEFSSSSSPVHEQEEGEDEGKHNKKKGAVDRRGATAATDDGDDDDDPDLNAKLDAAADLPTVAPQDKKLLIHQSLDENFEAYQGESNKKHGDGNDEQQQGHTMMIDAATGLRLDADMCIIPPDGSMDDDEPAELFADNTKNDNDNLLNSKNKKMSFDTDPDALVC